MENLVALDNLSLFKYGTLDIDFDYSNYVKFKDDDQVYFLTSGKCDDLMTLQPLETLVFRLEDVELEMEPGSIYYIKPAPENSPPLGMCNVKRFTSTLCVNATNVSEQLGFARERIIDVLTSAIGRQKVAMTCWPFKNVTVDQFLEKCTIPYSIFLAPNPIIEYNFNIHNQKEKIREYYECHKTPCTVALAGSVCRLFDKSVTLRTFEKCKPASFGKDDEIHYIEALESFKTVKLSKDLDYNGFLFSNDGFLKLNKRIDYCDERLEWCVERIDYVITKKTSTKYEKAFVVFNPDSPTNEKEFIILQYINDVKKVDDVISFNSL